MKVLLSFDTEDFVTPEADDAVLYYARILSERGIRVCAGAMLDGGDGQPAWFAGIVNLGYDLEHLVDPFLTPAVADQATREIQHLQLQREQGDGYLAVFTHPTRLVTDEFWDAVNLPDNRLSTGIALQPAPLKTPSETASIKRKFESTLDALQRDGTSFLTYSDLNDEVAKREDRPVDDDTISTLAARILERFDYHDIDGRVFSPTEAFVILGRAARDVLQSGHLCEQPPPDAIGPTQAIPAAVNPHEVHVEQLKQTLKHVFDRREVDDVPVQINVHTTVATPQWLLAASAALIRSGDRSIERITVPRLPEYPAAADSDAFRHFRYRGTWPILPPDFQGKNLIELNRLQSWSYKPCRAT